MRSIVRQGEIGAMVLGIAAVLGAIGPVAAFGLFYLGAPREFYRE